MNWIKFTGYENLKYERGEFLIRYSFEEDLSVVFYDVAWLYEKFKFQRCMECGGDWTPDLDEATITHYMPIEHDDDDDDDDDDYDDGGEYYGGNYDD